VWCAGGCDGTTHEDNQQQQQDTWDGHCPDRDSDKVFDKACIEQHRESFGPDFDCDDNNPRRNSLSQEICDGLDNDCDDLIDEDLLALPCPLNSVAGSVCAESAPTYRCVDGTQDSAQCLEGCGSLGSATCPYGELFTTQDFDSQEACTPDRRDNNCDGRVDERLESFGCPCGGFICGNGVPDDLCPCAPKGTVQDRGGAVVCTDDQGQPIPSAFDRDEDPTTPLDDNCDGQINEAP
jgi:hypothetical protein